MVGLGPLKMAFLPPDYSLLSTIFYEILEKETGF